MKRLLSVDWDYFFPIPNSDDETWLLYDWGHKEAPLFMGSMLWYSRDALFQARGLSRPTVNDQWKTFWSRVEIDPQAEMVFGESHSWAAAQEIAEDVTEVWSFDAHHDLGYNLHDLEDAVQGSYTCGTWLVHYVKNGAKVHVRYPEWKDPEEDGRPKIGQLHDLATYDPLERLPIFDRVFVCRSGAWVPPWCDEDYVTFVHDCPVPYEQKHDLAYHGWPSSPREYDENQVREHVDGMSMALDNFRMEKIRGK
jgi:hypothetical protein